MNELTQYVAAATPVPLQQPIPYSDLERMAIAIARSKLFGVQEPNQAIALCLIAQAEGLHPAIAARDFHIIQGRPAKSAEAIHRAFLAAGGKIEWHRLDDDVADATFSHPSGGTFRCAWDMDRARQAGLGGKENWKKYPRAMLRSRCISEGCRTVYPGATSGMYTPEEVRDMPKEKAVAGEVISLPPQPGPPSVDSGVPPEPPIGAGSAAHEALEARISELGLNREGVKTWCVKNWGVEHFPDLTPVQQRDLVFRLTGFAVTKLMRQIPLMNAADLEALIESPPGWLQLLPDEGYVMEAADRRLTAITPIGDSAQDSASEADSDPIE